MNVRLVDEVFLDVRTARDWYNQKSVGLGDEFADVLFSTRVVCHVFPFIMRLTRLDIDLSECLGLLR